MNMQTYDAATKIVVEIKKAETVLKTVTTNEPPTGVHYYGSFVELPEPLRQEMHLAIVADIEEKIKRLNHKLKCL